MEDTRIAQQKFYTELVNQLETAPTLPEHHRGYAYYTRFATGCNLPIYCRRSLGHPEAPEEVILDQNREEEVGSYVSIQQLAISPDNAFLAYTIDTTAQDQYSLRIKHLASNTIIKEEIIPHVVRALWAPDSKSIYYTIPDAQLRAAKVGIHKLGHPIEQDKIVYEDHDPIFFVDVANTKDERYLVISSSSKTTTEAHLIDTSVAPLSPNIVQPRKRDIQYFIEHAGSHLYRLSNDRMGLPNYYVSRIHDAQLAQIHKPGVPIDPTRWETFYEPAADACIEDSELFASHMFTYERQKGLPQIKATRLDNKEQTVVPLPEPLCAIHLASNSDYNPESFIFSYSSPIMPETTYKLRLADMHLELVRSTKIPGYDPSQFQCKRIWADSHDGTRIPVTVFHRNDIQLDETTRLFMHMVHTE
eukprot:TRINITY_DN5959_c0_g1_i2.p1 TRINITY_DN5959_c0_g1~~TRINITY_DN5959_c0_g1_i2.p1  ORF type:complete len:485 (+),score=44.57 TRINITY_DN5959_c0_g1_i2:205-1455(+)